MSVKAEIGELPPQILIDGTCVPVKEEIANPEVETVAKWNSFYHCAEWQNIACINIPHTKFVYILNVSHKFFEQLVHQNEPSLL